MPNIRPVSDLRNYNDVLSEITVDSPVFLTKNGKGLYAIVDMKEYDKQRATIKLLPSLQKAKRPQENTVGFPKKKPTDLLMTYDEVSSISGSHKRHWRNKEIYTR